MIFGFYKSLFISLLCLFLCSGTLFSEETPFVFQKGFWQFDSFDNYKSGLGGIYQNPSLLSLVDEGATKLDYSTNGWGYQQVSVGSVFRHNETVVSSVGVQSYFATDIPVVTRTSSERATVISSLSDYVNQYRFAVAYSGLKKFVVGVSGGVGERYLSDDRGRYFFADFGLTYKFPNALSFGMYTQNFIKSDLVWRNSGTQEEIPLYWYFVFNYAPKDYEFRIKTMFEHTQLRGSYSLNPWLELTGDVLMDVQFELLRYQAGVVLKLEGFSIQYAYLNYLDSDLGLTQNILGMLVRL